MSQKRNHRRTLSQILKEHKMMGKKEEKKNKKRNPRCTRRKRTGKSLSQLLNENNGKKVNNRWTRKKQPPIHNPTTGWEVDDLFAPMPGMTLSEEYRLNHRGDKEKSNSSIDNKKKKQKRKRKKSAKVKKSIKKSKSRSRDKK